MTTITYNDDAADLYHIDVYSELFPDVVLLLYVIGENWQEAITQDLSPMHILTPLTVSLDVYKCIVSDTNLPKYEYDSHTGFTFNFSVLWQL